MNTSATGGVLQPLQSLQGLEGATLENFIQGWFTGLLNCPPTIVRPAYQPEPANIPPPFVWWMAFAFEDVESDTYPAFVHTYATSGGIEVGQDEMRRSETFDVLCSFYDLGQGGQARAQAKFLRDQLSVAQNLETLFVAGFGFVECMPPIRVPTLTNMRWLYRMDLRVRLRQMWVRDYPVVSILSLPALLENGRTQNANVVATLIGRGKLDFADSTQSGQFGTALP